MCDLFINVIFELIAHFQQLSVEMIGNENIEKKQLGKRSLHLNRLDFQKFLKNLVVVIHKL